MSDRAAREPADVDTGPDYDGVREFDNPLPRWWLMTFYGAIIFAVGYWFYYHTLEAGALPMAEYQAEIKRAAQEEDAREAKAIAEGRGITDDQLVAMSHDGDTVKRGEAVFKQNCVVCHGDRGQGVIGPNLTDEYWIHGDKAHEMYQVISNGVLDKGMPAWRPVLGGAKIKDALAFVLTLRDTHVPGKPPQGKTADGRLAPTQ
jgi:cytochrome c oxidase cbb3-type subunit 3